MTMKHLYHRLGDGAYALGIKLFAKTLKKIRKNGVQNYPKSRQALLEVGVFPVADHYYEPQFAFSKEEIEKFVTLQPFAVIFVGKGGSCPERT